MKKIGYLLAIAMTISALVLLNYEGPKTEQPKFETASELDFVKGIDFQRFMGIWYNIASLPNAIEKNCKCAQTLDTLESKLTINLAESCIMFGKNITSNSKAVATVDGYGNWTNVNGPLKAQYWILNLDQNYEWVIIGQPSRKGFWIMNRKPHMDQNLLRSLIDWGTAHEFNLKTIEFQDQSCFNKEKHLQIETPSTPQTPSPVTLQSQ